MREILEDSIRRLLQAQVTPESLRQAESGEWPGVLWSMLEEGGFTLALVREESGGSGLTWGDAYPVVAAAGEHALPLPLPETMLAAWLLDRAGLSVPPGPLGVVDPGDAPLPIAHTAPTGGWRLQGSIAQVPWGRAVGHVVLAVQFDGQVHLALLKNEGLDWVHDSNLAREPRDALALDGAMVQTLVPWPDAGAGALGLRQHGAMLRSAQMAGAMERLVALSARYATERVQFGRAIGQFQAIQQQLAVLACAGAAAQTAAAFAFEQADSAGAALATASAKARSSLAAGEATSIAHATHGAIGFTYEHTLHFLSRRLWSWRSEFGHHAWWSGRIGRAVRESEQPFWHLVTQGELALSTTQEPS